MEPGFRMTLADTEALKDSIKIIKELISEATFKVDNKGLHLVEMDNANVCMVIYDLYDSVFTEYQTTKEFSVGLNLNMLYDKLKKSNKEDILIINYDETKPGDLFLTFKNKNTRTAQLKVLELERENKIPELNFTATITTDSTQLKKDFEFIKDYCSFTLKTNNDRVELIGYDDLSCENKVTIKADDDTKIVIRVDNEGETIKAKYSSEYFVKFLPSDKISDRVMIQYGNDYVMKITYGARDKYQLSFLTAPRVDND